MILLAVGQGSIGSAGIIYFNLDPGGTTANQNINGSEISGVTTQPATVASNATVNWSAANNETYRDYQFAVSTTSGTAVFDGYAVQLSAKAFGGSSSFEGGNYLRSTIWAGAIPTIPSGATTTPSFSTSLGQTSLLWSAFDSTSFTTAILGPGAMTPQTIGTSDSVFFIRIWADGARTNDGFFSKLATGDSGVSSIQISSDDPDLTVRARLSDGSYSPNLSTFTPTPAPVPEPSGAAIVVLGLASGLVAALRRAKG